MKDKKILYLECFVLFFVMAFMFGCAQTFFTGFDTQSHFEYPNSNITPLGKAAGEASTTSLFTPPYKTAELEEEAINNALKQKGGDILINYMIFEKKTSLLFILHTLTLRVEGTAAKMKIGTQKLY